MTNLQNPVTSSKPVTNIFVRLFLQTKSFGTKIKKKRPEIDINDCINDWPTIYDYFHKKSPTFENRVI